MENEISQVLKKRRSIRRFKEEKVDKEIIEQVLKAGLLAPSSKNKKPVEFIVVEDKEILLRLKDSKDKGTEGLKTASFAIVVIADSQLSDVWIEDASIGGILIQIAASELGLGSCWIQIRNRKNHTFDSEDEVRKILNIPNKYGVLSIMALGYKDEDYAPYDDKSYDFSKVHYGRF